MPPMTEGTLTNLVFRLWPAPIEKRFNRDSKWYCTLLIDAGTRGIKPKTTWAYFLATFKFDFVGFECVEGCWKVVYKIRGGVTLHVCEGGLKIPVIKMTNTLSRDLVFMAEIPAEKLIDIAPVEEVGVMKNVQGHEFEERHWRFVEPVRE